ncbi:MAG: hypothetical protein V3U59_06280 [Gammaproteobacteria bacterium]
MAAIRRHQTAWAGRTLGVFVVAWFTMALQPCAMAFGGEHESDCPHCPPTHEMPCQAGAANCDATEDYNYDGRTPQIKVKDLASVVAVAITTTQTEPVLHSCNTVSSVLDVARHPGAPPLNVQYCVFLN